MTETIFKHALTHSYVLHEDKRGYSFFDESATMVVALCLPGKEQFITALTPEAGETGTSTNYTS
jgi:hypothetical protein